MDAEHTINVKQALRVFDKATKEGRKEGNEWHYQGLTVSTDFDGYTLFINSPKVKLTVFFHNKFSVDSTSRKELEEFIRLLDRLDSE
ncbi:DUF3081 domain-containing protein [Microbulbifer sp. OS29]|uniref:DUF3081 domain-containing protein n=1 Tax=Microbulbifer okhotskensis TaxID=2926617 RepID=A0A9X2ESI6_9GAMM|nr:DUF3081 family protein [Microbulbifer okhotskensis]MCO1334941.1 DUF3081 domain-containing protein [Microbulbifer okhotskensis]